MSTGIKRIVVGVLALAAVLVVGCGSSDSTSSDITGSPEDTVQAFYDASQQEDGAAVCATLTTASQDLAAAGGDSCEAAFAAAVKSGGTSVPKDFTIDGSAINGTTATVDVTGDGQQQTFNLVVEDSAWKLDFSQAAGTSTDSSTGVTDSTTG